jgi:hypothetical protein
MKEKSAIHYASESNLKGHLWMAFVYFKSAKR